MTTNKAKGGLRRPGLGLYVHIPFCVKKCDYCDFPSFPGRGDTEQEAYVKALCREIARYGQDGCGERGGSELRREENGGAGQIGESQEAYISRYSVDTIFLGGGTPSLLRPSLICDILDSLGQVFSIEAEAEITIEANPGTLGPDKLKAYRSMGINRLSMGVQSLDDGILQGLGRIHSREEVLENYGQARRAGFENINLDLMFGIPDQGLGQWEATLDEALSLSPEHLSFYSLQIEEGTPFYHRFASGRLSQPSQELDRKMYHRALSRLEEEGYLHYEISNAARKGFACRHNMKYWTMEDYLGLGLSAHSYIRGVRFFNSSDMKEYAALSGPADIHKNDRRDSVSDYLFTGMRLVRGMDLDDFHYRYGESVFQMFPGPLERFQAQGLLEIQDRHLRFTRRGLDFTNTVLRELMQAGEEG